jgi:hypothetical protein
MKTLGIVLIVIGILMFIIPNISYTKKEKVVDAGPIEINKKEKETIQWPLYAGGIAIAAGVIVLIAAKKK